MLGGAEPHRRRLVEHQPGGEVAVLGVLADVRLVQPGGHVPVDVPDVVLRRVLAQVGEVDPGAAEHRAVGALQPPVEPADDLPLQAPQQAVGRRWSRPRGPVQRRVRDGQRGQHPGQHGVGGDVVGERLVGEHQAVPQHVEGQFGDVVRERRSPGRG